MKTLSVRGSVVLQLGADSELWVLLLALLLSSPVTLKLGSISVPPSVQWGPNKKSNT